MANDAEVFRKLEQASIGTAAHVLRALHELYRGDAPRPARPNAEGDSARDVIFDVARLLLTGYEGVLALQERYFDDVADGLRELRCRGTTGGEVSRGRLRIEGSVGGVARGPFRLENELEAEVQLTFRFGEFVAAQDERRFAAAVTVGPPAADVARASDRRLAPRERRVFEVAVRLDAATFQPWHTYVGDIQVLRDGQLVAELTVEVSAKP